MLLSSRRDYIPGFFYFSKKYRIKKEKIKVVKKWEEPKSVREIQIFFSFANFYHYFIKGFTKIAAVLTFMLKITTLKLIDMAHSVNKILCRDKEKEMKTKMED